MDTTNKARVTIPENHTTNILRTLDAISKLIGAGVLSLVNDILRSIKQFPSTPIDSYLTLATPNPCSR